VKAQSTPAIERPIGQNGKKLRWRTPVVGHQISRQTEKKKRGGGDEREIGERGKKVSKAKDVGSGREKNGSNRRPAFRDGGLSKTRKQARNRSKPGGRTAMGARRSVRGGGPVAQGT